MRATFNVMLKHFLFAFNMRVRYHWLNPIFKCLIAKWQIP